MVETKSPNPSIDRHAASSNPETKKALEMWDLWCSTLWSLALMSPRCTPSAAASASSTPRTLATLASRFLTSLVNDGRFCSVKRIFLCRFALGSREIAT